MTTKKTIDGVLVHPALLLRVAMRLEKLNNLELAQELRALLDAPAKSDYLQSCEAAHLGILKQCKPAAQHQGEPVAWIVTDMNGDSYFAYDRQTPNDKPLYAEQPAPVAVAQKYDDTLLPFVALMRKELHANSGKGDRQGWLSMSSDTCLLEIIYHFGKLQASVKRQDEEGIREYAADVANMCMMLVDICEQ